MGFNSTPRIFFYSSSTREDRGIHLQQLEVGHEVGIAPDIMHRREIVGTIVTTVVVIIILGQGANVNDRANFQIDDGALIRTIPVPIFPRSHHHLVLIGSRTTGFAGAGPANLSVLGEGKFAASSFPIGRLDILKGPVAIDRWYVNLPELHSGEEQIPFLVLGQIVPVAIVAIATAVVGI